MVFNSFNSLHLGLCKLYLLLKVQLVKLLYTVHQHLSAQVTVVVSKYF